MKLLFSSILALVALSTAVFAQALTPEEAAELQKLETTMAEQVHPNFKIKAVKTMKKFKSHAVPPLLRALEYPGKIPEFQNIRREAAVALGEIADPRAIPALTTAATTAKDTVTREAAAAALGAIHDPKVVKPLTDLLRAPEPLIRQAAAKGLEAGGSPDAIAPLIQALAFRPPPPKAKIQPDVRHVYAKQAVLRALGGLLSQPTIAPLVRSRSVDDLAAQLRDPDPAIRTVAAEVLGRVGHGHAKALQSLQLLSSTDKDFSVRSAAATALQQISGKPAAPQPPGVPISK